MNPFLTQIVVGTVLRQKRKKSNEKKTYSDYILAKAYREWKINILRNLKDLILIVTGIFSASFGFKGFLLTCNFIDGGATGISLLITALTHWPLYLLLPCINLPFILLAYKMMGKKFALKTGLSIIGLALCLALVNFPTVTNDKLLVSVFGGFFLGSGIGLAVRGSSVIDGTEVLAIYLGKRFHVSIGDVIMGINILIFSAAAFLLSVEIALYSLVTYFVAGKALDFVVEGIEEYHGVTIVSAHHDEIREKITLDLGRGVTVYTGQRGFRKDGQIHSVQILYTVITRLELSKIQTEIEKIDPNAFVVINKVKDIKGGIVKKRPLKG